jgi:AAA15 family ATPase/GTPase
MLPTTGSTGLQWGREMLTRVRIKGYKSFMDAEVALRPIVVLIGTNASGKSNFLDALQFL